MTFDIDGLDGVRLPLIGSYQPRNAAVAITALRVLRERGEHPGRSHPQGAGDGEPAGPVRAAAAFARLLLDGSHNAHGMRATVQSSEGPLPRPEFVFLLSIMATSN